MNLHHIGILVFETELLTNLFETMSWKKFGQTYNSTYGIEAQFISNGQISIELFVPKENKNLRNILRRNGNHIHHLAFEVEDIETQANLLESKGYHILGDTPAPGFEGRPVVFIDPLDSKGILIELIGKR
ncbi:VOC family protein [Thermodesulfobacteriota bacterium]